MKGAGVFAGHECAHSNEVSRQHSEAFVEFAEFAREAVHQALKLVSVVEVCVVRCRNFAMHTVGG